MQAACISRAALLAYYYMPGPDPPTCSALSRLRHLSLQLTLVRPRLNSVRPPADPSTRLHLQRLDGGEGGRGDVRMGHDIATAAVLTRRCATQLLLLRREGRREGMREDRREGRREERREERHEDKRGSGWRAEAGEERPSQYIQWRGTVVQCRRTVCIFIYISFKSLLPLKTEVLAAGWGYGHKATAAGQGMG